ncbi:MAG: Gfo/Idh/MocA family oxidoreductase [Lentisphaeria bacterium]|nr:Gfo/Idh/MocA family oxidoreductase [Lentisphaeria bacterium]
MKKIRIAQIGITHEHAAGKILSLEKLPEIYEIAGAVNDLEFNHTPRYINEVQDYYKKYPFLTLDEVLNDPTIQAVTVEVPNNELVEMAIKCAEKGIAIHMDKPAGIDLELYRKLLQICKEKNVPFQMGFMFRGNPAFQFCIKAIRQKWIGDVICIEGDMNHGYGGEEYQKYIAQFAGGLMYNLGCHLIDFIAAAMGRPENVTGFLHSAPGDPQKIKNNCLAVLEYPNAYAVVKSCSRQKNCVNTRTVRIVGTNGVISFSPIERFDGKPIVLNMELKENLGYPAGVHQISFPIQRDRYTEQLLELARVIRKETEMEYSPEHDFLVHEITLAAAGYTDWK